MRSEIIINRSFPGINPVQFGFENCRPNHSYGPAVRTYWLLHYVSEGFGTFIRDGKTISVKPGEIFVISPYIETYYEADNKKPWHYTWIGFTADISLPEVLNEAVICCPAAGKLFEEMRYCINLSGGKEAFLLGKIWELLSLLMEETVIPPDYVQKALACMQSEYMTGITVEEIARRLGLARSYFSALFSKSRGISPRDYLVSLRLEKAAELMVKYRQPPSTVAISTGYSDIFNFSKMFKKHFGISPREYQRMHLNK